MKNNSFWRTHLFFLVVIFFIIATNLAVFLNLPVLKPLLAIIFLGLFPGWLMVIIFRLQHLGTTEKIVLSVGLSHAFLMGYGCVLNQISLYFGYSRPLSPGFLGLFLSLALLIMLVIAYFINKEAFKLNFPKKELKLNLSDKLMIGLALTFPVLSIFGTYLMNLTNNNIFLMVLLFFIPVCLVLTFILKDKLSVKTYPVLIFFTGLSLLLMFGLRSNHIIGSDAHMEYYLFQLTSHFQSWHLCFKNNVDACLSISLLPAIYQSFLNINPEYLFKLFYPLLFSISPLVIYIISKKYVGHFYAFLASFFFMSFFLFSFTTANARTNTAILFFALAIMVSFHSKITPFVKKGLFIIFVVATIVSHYSTTYIFFVILVLTWLAMELFLKLFSLREKFANKTGIVALNENSSIAGNPLTTDILPGGQLENQGLKRGITFFTAALFFVLLFVWYSQVTAVPFNSGVNFVFGTIKSLQNFFVLESRQVVPAAFGVGLGEKKIPCHIEFVFNWITIILIIIGVAGFLWDIVKLRRKGLAKTERTEKFFFHKMDLEYFMLSLICLIILIISVVFPLISTGYDLARTYLQMISILAPLFILGGIFILRYLKLKISPAWLLVLVLIPYFWSQTGFTYQITGFPRSMVLNSKGEQYDRYFIYEQEVSSAKWLKNNGELKDNEIYTDYLSGDILVSLVFSPAISLSKIIALHNNQNLLLEQDSKISGYIYLRHFNVVGGKLLDRKYKSHDIAKNKGIFKEKDKIYSNSGSEVWK